ADFQAENAEEVLVFPDLQGAAEVRDAGEAVVRTGDLARARAADQDRQRAAGAQWLDLIARPTFEPGRLAELVEQRAAQLQEQDRHMRQTYETAIVRSHAERAGQPVLTTTAPAP